MGNYYVYDEFIRAHENRWAHEAVWTTAPAFDHKAFQKAFYDAMDGFEKKPPPWKQEASPEPADPTAEFFA